MKKKIFVLLLIVGILTGAQFTVTYSNQQGNGNPPPEPPPPPQVTSAPTSSASVDDQLLNEAMWIINRSAQLMQEAFAAAAKGHQCAGLALAVANQLTAKEWCCVGHYEEAIFFAVRARELALQIIEANGEKPDPELLLNHLERNYAEKAEKKTAQLDEKLDWAKVGGGDDDMINRQFDFDM